MARRITLNIVTTSDPKGVRQTRRALTDMAKRIRQLNTEFSKLSNSVGAFSDISNSVNRLSRDFEQLSRAQKEMRAELRRGASDAEKAAKGYNKASEAQQKYTQTGARAEKQQKRTRKAVEETAEELERMDDAFRDSESQARRANRSYENIENSLRDLGRTAGIADDKIESFQATMRDASKLVGGMDRQRRSMKELYEDMKKGEREVQQAMDRRRLAQERLDALMASPGRSERQIREAREELEASSRASAKAEKSLAEYQRRIEKMTNELRQYADVQERLNRFRADPAFEKMFANRQVAATLNNMVDSMESFEAVGRRLGTTMGNTFNRIKTGVRSLKEMDSQTDDLVASLKRLMSVGNDVSKLSFSRFAEAIGNPAAAIRETTKAIRGQSDEMIKLSGSVNRMDRALDVWRQGEEELRRAMLQGNAAMRMRNQIASTYGTARSFMSTASTQLEQQRLRLMQQQNRLTEESISLQNRLRAAEAAREGVDRRDIVAYEKANDAVVKLTQAIRQNDAAIESNENNIKENAAAAQRASTEYRQLEQATGRMHAQMLNLRTVVQNDMFGTIVTRMRAFNQQIMQVAQALGGRLISAIQRASAALRNFVGLSGGAMFAGLQRSLQGIGNGFTRFADNVVNSMDRARHSMMEFYAAGYSMMMMGSQLQQFGLQVNREMGRQLTNYMDYEAARNQAAVAGAEPIYNDGTRGSGGNWQSGIASYDINTEIVDRIVRGMQYGTYTPEWLNPSGQPMPVAFDAKELAQGLYYYSSAIGVPITSVNEREVAGVLTTIMQAAKVTNTGIETATKGTMNVAMEFGYDPRDLSPENAEAISSISARMAYLANISTMEMSDVAETFKMVGPQAHFLSPGALQGQPGAGLDETFLLAFLASEVGLRGGNVGRGINQAFTSLLDPTEKMLEVAGKHFGDGEKWTTEQFNEFFKEDGALKGGIRGFLETLQEVPREAQATMLAELFTSNATRALMGPVLAGAEFDIDKFLTEMDENPFLWLEAAVAQTANSVNGWFQFMQNGFFQFVRSVIDSISGPLMTGFEFIGTFFFEIAEALSQFPQLGQMLSGFVAAISGISIAVGTLMMAAGGILIVGRSFALLGGFIMPAIRMLAFAGITLLGLVPALLAVGIAVGVLRGLWTTDFLGMKTAFENFTEGTDLRAFMNDVAQGFTKGFLALTEIINQFAVGILLATGPVDKLYAAMNSLFGPLVGDIAIGALSKLREHMRGVREEIEDWASSLDSSGVSLRTFGLAIQGFLEQLVLGRQRGVTADAQDAIGNMLGVDNLSSKMASAAAAVGQFVSIAIQYGTVLVGVWRGLMTQVYMNIIRIFSSTGLAGIFEGLGTVASGVFAGILASFTAVLGVMAKATDIVADFAESLRNAGDSGKEILGFTITFDRLMAALGVTIGAAIGARLLVRLSPIVMLFARAVPIVASLAAAFVGLAGRIAVVVAQVALSVAAWGAQLAVIAAVTAAKLLLQSLNAGLAASQVAVSVATTASTATMTAQTGVAGFLTGVLGLLTGALTVSTVGMGFAATASALFTAALTAVAAASMLLIAAMAGVIVILSSVAIGAVILVTATQGLSAGFSALVSIAQGVWAGLQPGISVLGSLVSAIMEVVSAISLMTGAGNDFYTLGVLIGGAASVAMIAISSLAVSTTLLATRLVVVRTAMISFRAATMLVSASIVVFRGAMLAIQGSVASAAAAMMVLRGVMALVRAGAVASAAAMAASWLVSLGPIALVGAAIVGLGLLIWAFRDEIWSALQGIPEMWDNLWMRIQLGAASALESIINTFASAWNSVVDTINSDTAWSMLPETQAFNREDVEGIKIGDVDFTSGIEQEIRSKRALTAVTSHMNEVNGALSKGNAEAEEHVSTFTSIMEKLGLGGVLEDVSVKLGIDLEEASLSDLQDLFTGLTDIESVSDDLGDIDWTPLLGPKADEFQAAMDDWTQWENVVERLGGVNEATEFYENMGWEIPTAPDFEDYLDSAEELEEAAYSMEEAARDWKTAVESLGQMTLPDMFGALYDPLAGLGTGEAGSSLIGFMSQIGDSVIAKAQEGGGGQWLNMNELLADVAGTGIALDENLAGRNLHTALRPAFEILSRQTGVAIETLMEDIPMFQGFDEFQNIATVDMTQGISQFVDQFGTDMYETVDTSLQGLINRETGEAFFEYGLEWSELNNYAIGKAIRQEPWNLADFVAEVMGTSTEAANQVLLDAGLSQEAINAFSNNMYDGLEEAVLSNAGAYNALTEEQYQWLSDATGEFSSNVIRMSEEEFGQMSDTMKLILTNMGFSFVIEEFVPPEAFAAARSSISDFADVIEGAGDTIVAAVEGANLQMDGAASEWSEVSRYFDEAAQDVMVVLEDIDGTQITIPAADYDAFLGSLETVTSESRAYLDELDRIFREFGGDWSQPGMRGAVTEAEREASMRSGMNAGTGPAAGLPPALKVPVGAGAEEARRVVAEMETEFASADFTDEIRAAFEVDGKFTITPEFDFSRAAEGITGLGLGIQALSLIPISLNFSPAAVAITSLGLGLQALSLIPISLDFSPAAAAITSLGLGIQALSLIPIELNITANTASMISDIQTALGAWGSGAPGGGSVPGAGFEIAVTAKVTNVNTDLMSTLYGEEGFQMSVVGLLGEVRNEIVDEVKIPAVAAVSTIRQALNTDFVITGVVAQISTFRRENDSELTIEGVVAVISTFRRADNGELSVDVKANITGFDFPDQSLRVPVTAYINSLEVAALFGSSIRVPVTAYVNTFETANLFGAAQPRVPVTAYVNTFDVANLFGAEQPRVPVTAYVSSFEADALFTEPVRIPVVAEISGSDALQSLVTQAQAFAVVWTGTFTALGADTSALAIGNAVGLAKTFASTWNATISESGGTTTGAMLSGLIALGEVFAVTWTATMAQTGAAIVKSAIQSLIDKAREFAKTWTATVSLNNYAQGALSTILSQLRTIDGYTASATITTNRVTRYSTQGAPGVATGGRIGSAGMKGKRSLEYNPDTGDMRGLYASQVVARATGGITRPGELTLVGELGPELVTLPTGSYVHTARQTTKMLNVNRQENSDQSSYSVAISGTQQFGSQLGEEIAKELLQSFGVLDGIVATLVRTLSRAVTGIRVVEDAGAWQDVGSGMGRRQQLANAIVAELNSIISSQGARSQQNSYVSYQHSSSYSRNMVNPFTGSSTTGTTLVNSSNKKEGDTYTFGDVIIQAPDAETGRAAVDRFFEQIDRRAGHRNELAQRGMVATDDPRFW